MDRIEPIASRVPAPVNAVVPMRRVARKGREEREEEARRRPAAPAPAHPGDEDRDDGLPHVDVLA
jgi:hypothetical protein